MRTGAFDLAALYAQHAGLVRWIVLGVGTPRHAVDDLVQDAFVAAYRRRDAAPEGAVERRRWLAGVARSVCHHHRRGVARRRRRQVHWASAEEAAAVRSLDDELEARLALRRVCDVLATMDPAQREAYVLVELHGMSAPEAASVLGTKLNTIYSRVRLARRRLEAALPEVDAMVHAARTEGRARPEQRRTTWALIVAKLGLPTAAVSTGAGLGTVGGALVGAGLGAGMLGVILGVSLLTGSASASSRGTAEIEERIEAVSVTARSASRDEPHAAGLDVDASASPLLPPPADLPAPALEPAAEARPAAATPSRRATRKAPHTESIRDTAPRPPSALSEEARLLREAARALDAGDRDRASTLLDRHRDDYPDGVLADERRRLRARA